MSGTAGSFLHGPSGGRLAEPGVARRRSPHLARGWLVRLGSALLLWLGALAAQAEESPQQLLERMNRALEQVEFTGTLVYLHGQDLAALRITHRIKDGNPGESMLSLTGPVRALSRHPDGVTCMLPDAAPLTVHKTPGRQSGVLRQVPLDFARLRSNYHIGYLGHFRVAGRDTEVVGVLAKDSFRYGYRFYVDEATGLPLKMDLLTEDEAPIQQLMFTDIAIEGQAEAPIAPPTIAQAPASADGGSPWLTGHLPPGFRVVSDEVLAREDGATIRQLMLSDGLASLSVYVEPPLDGALQGESQLGAVSAAGGRLGEHQVTVVGEVPPATARRVLELMDNTPDGS